MNTQVESIENKVLEMIFEVTAVPVQEIKPEHRLREDLGMDSVRAMELVSMLDEELGVEVELEEAMAVQTVEDMFTMARRHG